MNPVISNYESLSTLTGQMLAAASQGEWDQLIELEQQCSLHVAKMKLAEDLPELDDATRQRKIQLIKKIFADDAQIRSRTEGWMEQLQHILQSNKQEQRINQAYGAV
jgi:flagellar protein FliT